MKFILLVLTTISSLSVSATVTCHDGAMSEAFGLFQSKNVCTPKTLDHIYSNVKKLETNCKIKHTSYEAYLVESCQFGDESSCGKAKNKLGKFHQISKAGTDIALDLHGREALHKRFTSIIARMNDAKAASSGRSIASTTNEDLIADCMDAFVGYESDMKKWQQEHAHVRKRSIRAR